MNQNTTHPLRLLAVLALALLFALPTSLALHCNGEITEIIVVGEGIYLDDRSDGPGDINHWIYLESNGIEGLQSGGHIVWWPGCITKEHHDPCFAPERCQHPNPDSLLW